MKITFLLKFDWKIIKKKINSFDFYVFVYPSKMFKSVINIKINLESRLHCIDINTYHCSYGPIKGLNKFDDITV